MWDGWTDGPAMSPVKLSCIRTPCEPVTMTAAYAEPAVSPFLTITPALAQGSIAPDTVLVPTAGADGSTGFPPRRSST